MPFRRLPRQSRQLMAYVLAGGLTAVAHYGVLVGLVELAQVDPVPATLAGFVVGAVVSYVLNRWMTFEATRSHAQAGWRFGLIAVGGFGLTWVLMHLFVTRLGLPYLPMQFVTTGFVMVFSFLGHKFFSFADRAG
ncbi:GtrA family protein [Bosea sp. (in: a-proteobacteria)]|jgi:putative flippase GtrA|uniref:GtrA family protein n=1 Tax=Bosea sp. (in: a-proteobacteria) TaxID=1871050 RepID=UPI00226CD945|nr:GtrA family protein [Bosea sp. (in: a-proteobacteria)]MCZ8043480.1 GtrA family protein [Beijerinckiaceae bacterium]WRH60142.1 MAG: GtrA family protein [Bosea sp. (in: a-proteobacteria)]